MISLNLNSPHQKREVKLDHFYHLLRYSLAVVSIIIILSSVLLLLARDILQDNFNTVVVETSLVHQQIRGSNQKIININKDLNNLNQVQDKFIPWSNVLVYITKIVPPNIKINLLTINSADVKTNEHWVIAIKGLAKARDDFLIFQDKLKASKFFDKVEIPINNITQKENIEFEFKVTIATEKIKSNKE